MTGYFNKFDENKTSVSLLVKNKQLLKSYNKILKKTEGLISIDFNSKTTYGDDDDKYIKTKIKTYADIIIANFHNKKYHEKRKKRKSAKRKSTMQMSINNNARFCY